MVIKKLEIKGTDCPCTYDLTSTILSKLKIEDELFQCPSCGRVYKIFVEVKCQS